MKAIYGIFLLTSVALCELPPSYPQQGFRPSPQFLNQYRPSAQRITAVDVEIPTKLTIEQLIRLTEQLQNNQGRIANRPQKLAQNSYLPPPRAPQQTLQLNPYIPPFKLQNTYRASNLQQPGTTSDQLRPPSTSYGVPDTRNIETFENSRNLNDSSKQQLPNKSPTGFKQYLPPNGDGIANTGQEQSTQRPPNNYLPPQSTAINVPLSTTTTAPATTAKSFEGSTNYDYDYELQPTESPNISISNAVAGAGGFFYVQQPDGRLQRVVLKKTKEPNSKPEEYVANYYFQNIQALPNAVYTPLITLGSYTQK